MFYFFLWYNPGDIRTWVNWRNNVDISTSFSPSLSMLASNLDNSTENPLQNNIGREKDRTVLPKLSILDCWSPGSFILSWFQKLLAFWLAERLLWLRKSTITKVTTISQQRVGLADEGNHPNDVIGHLHDDIILLLRPESFKVLLSSAFLVLLRASAIQTSWDYKI